MRRSPPNQPTDLVYFDVIAAHANGYNMHIPNTPTMRSFEIALPFLLLLLVVSSVALQWRRIDTEVRHFIIVMGIIVVVVGVAFAIFNFLFT